MQVNHGLPGQVLLLNPDPYYIQNPKDQTLIVKTTDQYAYFRGKIHRAGYLSNFAFGYAVAAKGFAKGFTDLGSIFVSLKQGKLGDNPQDLEAMHEGYEAFWSDHTSSRTREWLNH